MSECGGRWLVWWPRWALIVTTKDGFVLYIDIASLLKNVCANVGNLTFVVDFFLQSVMCVHARV